VDVLDDVDGAGGERGVEDEQRPELVRPPVGCIVYHDPRPDGPQGLHEGRPREVAHDHLHSPAGVVPGLLLVVHADYPGLGEVFLPCPEARPFEHPQFQQREGLVPQRREEGLVLAEVVVAFGAAAALVGAVLAAYAVKGG
jgi:hypothetical protein